MNYIVNLKATKYLSINIDAPDFQTAKEYAMRSVRQNYPIVEFIDISDADLIEKGIVNELPMPSVQDHTNQEGN
jgi:hypothetical protein